MIELVYGAIETYINTHPLLMHVSAACPAHEGNNPSIFRIILFQHQQ